MSLISWQTGHLVPSTDMDGSRVNWYLGDKFPMADDPAGIGRDFFQ